jgi:hypothetical protein
MLSCIQAAGKKVILSIGGASGTYGFTSIVDANKYVLVGKVADSEPSLSRAQLTTTSMKPIGRTSTYLACKIGHLVPVLQPYMGALFSNDTDHPNHCTRRLGAVCQLSETMCQFFISLQHRGCPVECLPWRQCLQPALWKCSAGWHRP